MNLSGNLIELISTVFKNDIITAVLSAVIMIVGFFLLIKGADIFVEDASKIAEKLKVPLIVIGLTIVAFGTSAPEAAISITSSAQGNAGIAVGNIIGSNIMNILVILGISALIGVLPVNKNTFKFEIPFVVIISAVLMILGIIGDGLQFYDGIILLVLFAAFFMYLIYISKKGDAEPGESTLTASDTFPKMILMIIIGLVMIVLGSDLTVAGASRIASICGIEDRIIGLTIVAFGTSLPELVTSIAATKRGMVDLAIGNIIGSNIFNILFVGGLAMLFSSTYPIEFSRFIIDAAVAIAAALILWILLIKDRKLKKFSGAVMLVVYAAYFVYLVLQPQIFVN